MGTQASGIANGCELLRGYSSTAEIGTALRRRRPQIARHLLLSLAFVLVYLILALPGTVFISHLGITAWYPANGLALGLLLEAGPWYALLVAFSDALAGTAIYRQPLLSFGETVGAASIAGLYALAAFVLRGPLRIDFALQRGRDVARYVFVATTAAMASTVTGVAYLVVDHTISRRAFWPTASNWFIGDEIGLLALTPFLLIHVIPRLRRRQTKLEMPARTRSTQVLKQMLVEIEFGRLLEAVGQVLSMLAVLWIMFGPRWGHLELLYLSFVPILWMAMQHGIRRAVTGILALNFGIVFAMHMFPPPPTLLDRIGILMLVVSATGLIVGSAVTERHKIGTELHERTTYLNALIENSPLGIAVLDRTGGVEMTNPAFTKLFECEQSDLIGVKLDSLMHDENDPLPATSWSAQVIGGHTLRRAIRMRQGCGKKRDLELQGVPLLINGNVSGAYTICRDISEEVRASKTEREHTEALSRLVKEMEVQTDQMTLLNEMAGLLECCATTKEACSVVDQFARKLFPEACSGALYAFRASRNLVEAALSWGEPDSWHPVFTPEACWALRRGQPHWSDTGHGVACTHLAEMPGGQYLCLPMVGQGETLGVLHLHFPPSAERPDWQASRQRLGATVAAQIALSLASLQSREKLRDQSIRDPLTSLFNRRFIEESLERELIRAKRKNQPLSVLFLDIDHFKRFNDTFGHDAGDLVLQSVADLLRKFFRGDDVACRWGGEEFAVILPDSPPQHAASRADTLRGEVKSLALRHRNVALATITLSIGVAAFPEHASTSGDLFKIADECLYQSKSAGRDCITVAARSEITEKVSPS
jgi:diguanylate cyclase (GGDEF)-like protein/PAS domain S-box-containing protein